MLQKANTKLFVRLILLVLLLAGIGGVSIYSKHRTVKLENYDFASGKAAFRQLNLHPGDKVVEFLVHFKFSSSGYNPFNTLFQTGAPDQGINIRYDIENGIILTAPDVHEKRVSSLSRRLVPQQSYKLDLRYYNHRITVQLRNHEVLFQPEFHVYGVDFTSLTLGGSGPGDATLPGQVKEFRAEYRYRPWWSFYASLVFALAFVGLFIESLLHTSLGKHLGRGWGLLVTGINSGFREQGYLFWSKIAYVGLAVFLAGLVIMNHL